MKRSTLEVFVVSDGKKKVLSLLPEADSRPGSNIVALRKEWSCCIRRIPWSTKLLKKEYKILGSMCADTRNWQCVFVEVKLVWLCQRTGKPGNA